MPKNLLVLVLVGIALILTACSNEEKTATIQVKIFDLETQFRPNEFTVPAGVEVTFTAINYGLAHNFIIFKKGFDAGAHFDHEDEPNIYWQIDLQGGGTTTGKFTAPSEPGEYSVVCSVHSHMEDGMVGKLIVVK
jgi:plastocyanin